MSDTKTTKELTSILWEAADLLRSKMDANEYKDYLLPILFYKYLSDKNLKCAYELISYDEEPSLEVKLQMYEDEYNSKEPGHWDELKEELQRELKYVLEPKYIYTNIVKAINNKTFKREDLVEAFKEIESSDSIFEGLFADVDLYSSKLGVTAQKQSDLIVDVLLKINEANLLDLC